MVNVELQSVCDEIKEMLILNIAKFNYVFNLQVKGLSPSLYNVLYI